MQSASGIFEDSKGTQYSWSGVSEEKQMVEVQEVQWPGLYRVLQVIQKSLGQGWYLKPKDWMKWSKEEQSNHMTPETGWWDHHLSRHTENQKAWMTLRDIFETRTIELSDSTKGITDKKFKGLPNSVTDKKRGIVENVKKGGRVIRGFGIPEK